MMNDHGHDDGRGHGHVDGRSRLGRSRLGRSRLKRSGTIWNGQERSGTKWNEVKKSVTSRDGNGHVKFSAKNERFTLTNFINKVL
jgi:hypothetical protein